MIISEAIYTAITDILEAKKKPEKISKEEQEANRIANAIKAREVEEHRKRKQSEEKERLDALYAEDAKLGPEDDRRLAKQSKAAKSYVVGTTQFKLSAHAQARAELRHPEYTTKDFQDLFNKIAKQVNAHSSGRYLVYSLSHKFSTSILVTHGEAIVQTFFRTTSPGLAKETNRPAPGQTKLILDSISFDSDTQFIEVG